MPRKRHGQHRRTRRVTPEVQPDLDPIVAIVCQAYPKAKPGDVRAWLLGDHSLSEDDRVLLDEARRQHRLRVAAAWLEAIIWTGGDVRTAVPTRGYRSAA
jgi:hypothetical protein